MRATLEMVRQELHVASRRPCMPFILGILLSGSIWAVLIALIIR